MTEPGEFLGLVARAELRSASGDWAEAAALWGQVTDGNPVHGDYWARLAEARFAAGDYAGAREAYQKVLDLGVRAEYRWPSEGELPDLQPGVVAYRIACCLAALGQRDEAIDALAVALDRGYRYLAQARDDERWKPIIGLTAAYTYGPTYIPVITDYRRTDHLPRCRLSRGQRPSSEHARRAGTARRRLPVRAARVGCGRIQSALG
jgi:tetratricopeptide (TPR) repeat protein